MTVKRLDFPYELDLIKAENWQDFQNHVYFIIRLHLFVEEYQAEDTTYPGEILASYHNPGNGDIDIVYSFKKDHKIVDVDEVIFSEVISEELSSGIQAELIGGLSSPFYQVSSKVGSSLQERINQTYTQTSRSNMTSSKQVTRTFEIHQKINADEKQKYHAVACYRPMRSDVSLFYIDYLFAEYKSSLMGLRKKKKNFPRPIANKHTNRIKINQPLFSLKYWKLLPQSSLIYSDNQYKQEKNKVKFVDKVEIERLEKPIHLPLPSYPEKPTLYTLSNIAFPFRWIDRKGEWSVDELKQIEFDEAEGTAWWFHYGPGRHRH